MSFFLALQFLDIGDVIFLLSENDKQHNIFLESSWNRRPENLQNQTNFLFICNDYTSTAIVNIKHYYL